MRIKFWGVRGSLPSTLPTRIWSDHVKKLVLDFSNSGKTVDDYFTDKNDFEIGGFGVATTCVQVVDSQSNQSLIIDGGSGIKYLSDQIERTSARSHLGEYHILMSHFHFDHILGIPFFSPHFQKGSKIHYYSTEPECEAVIRSLFKKPLFPVTYENLQSEIIFHTIPLYEKLNINGFSVTAYKLDHPDPCTGYRIEKNDKVYSHAVDHEINRITTADLGKDAGLFEKTHFLYIDAQYDEEDMSSKKGWGHGSFKRAFDVASEFNIPRMLLAHHDPALNLENMLSLRKKAKEEFKSHYKNQNLEWDFAHEGQEIDLSN